jgi:LysR family transcriptional regulator, chromosome initiation inhibitor
MSLLSPTLQAFWAVVKKGTVQEASHSLGLTQTGVTQRIRSLESQLKTTLFIRSRKGMRLTKEGEALLQYVVASFEVEGLALARIQKSAKSIIREVSIAGPSSILRARTIPQAINALKDFPGLRFRFDLSDTESNSEKLKSGLCDFAIVEHHDVTKEMDSKILKAERYKFYVAASWKRRAFSDIVTSEPIVDFNLNDKMTLNYLEKYRAKSKAIKERHFANNTDALLSMVGGGIGYTVLAEEFAQPYLKSGLISEIEPAQYLDYKVALAWYYRPELPPYMNALIKAVN